MEALAGCPEWQEGREVPLARWNQIQRELSAPHLGADASRNRYNGGGGKVGLRREYWERLQLLHPPPPPPQQQRPRLWGPLAEAELRAAVALVHIEYHQCVPAPVPRMPPTPQIAPYASAPPASIFSPLICVRA